MYESQLDVTRRQVLAIAAGAVMIQSIPVLATPVATLIGADDFNFLHGRWKVKHRKLKARLAGSSEWLEFSGTLDVKPILGGAGNVDENVINDPSGTYLASSIRIFEPSTQSWRIYWADARSAGLDKPVIGRFEGRIGRFYNDDEWDGRPIKVRFTYEDLGKSSVGWSQAFSPDQGKSWETNWYMDLTRETQA